MKITVEYPITIKKVIKTLSEARALGYTKEIAQWFPVNREFKIAVKTNKPVVTCEDLTGMSAVEYHSKFNIAWNE